MANIDPFDPHNADELGPFGDFLVSGTLVMEHLADQESMTALAKAIGTLSKRDQRAALLIGVITYMRRVDGIAPAEFAEWVMKDLPLRDDEGEQAA